MKNNRIATQLVQLGNQSDAKTGAISAPIYITTAYEHAGIGQSTGYDYSRTKNPTRAIFVFCFYLCRFDAVSFLTLLVE